MSAMQSANAVFLDPDKGLEIRNMTRSKKPTYALYNEMVEYYRTAKAVTCIQFARRCDPIERARDRRGELLSPSGAAAVPVVRARVLPTLLLISLVPDKLVEPFQRALDGFRRTADVFGEGKGKIDVIE